MPGKNKGEAERSQNTLLRRVHSSEELEMSWSRARAGVPISRFVECKRRKDGAVEGEQCSLRRGLLSVSCSFPVVCLEKMTLFLNNLQE